MSFQTILWPFNVLRGFWFGYNHLGPYRSLLHVSLVIWENAIAMQSENLTPITFLKFVTCNFTWDELRWIPMIGHLNQKEWYSYQKQIRELNALRKYMSLNWVNSCRWVSPVTRLNGITDWSRSMQIHHVTDITDGKNQQRSCDWIEWKEPEWAPSGKNHDISTWTILLWSYRGTMKQT